MHRLLASVAALLSAVSVTAQCPPPTQVVAPTLVPVSAGTWGIQQVAIPLQAGQLAYVVISLPTPTPIPFSALPWLFCSTVGNTPCLYVGLDGVSWFDIGPSQGMPVTVSASWPNNPALVGTLFCAQFGHAGCVPGTGPDLSVLVTVQLN